MKLNDAWETIQIGSLTGSPTILIGKLLEKYGDWELTSIVPAEVTCRDCGSRSWREVEKQPKAGFDLTMSSIVEVVNEMLMARIEKFECYIQNQINQKIDHAVSHFRAELVAALRTVACVDFPLMDRVPLDELADALEKGGK